MHKNIMFTVESIIIYITLGFSYCAANGVAHKYIPIGGRSLVFIGFYIMISRLFRYEKQKNVKLFNINVVYLNNLLMFVTIILYDLFHIGKIFGN